MKRWASLSEVFGCIQCDYVILRNYDELYNIDSLEDIDILTDNRDLFLKTIEAVPVGTIDNGFNYYIMVNEKKIFIDLRTIGDNYYCEQWEKNMLIEREKKDFYFRLTDKEYAFSYYYHLLIHKTRIDNERWEKLNRLMKKVGICTFGICEIKKYMENKGYVVKIPLDKNVDFNLINYKELV